MSATVQRAVSAVALLLSGAMSAPHLPARPAGLILDGLRDAPYQLLAQDAAGDLASDFAVPATTWADLTNLYVTTDTANLWAYVDLPSYSAASVGTFALVIDTDGLNASGSASGPADAGVTFAYTSTRNNVGSTPVLTTGVLLPDVVIHGNLFSGAGDAPQPTGWTELNSWTGAAWDHLNTNWGGITSTMTGTHVGFAYGHGLELSVPYADLGLAPTSTVHLEFYVLGRPQIGPPTGALDTVPSDAQATAAQVSTTEQRLATFNPGAPLISSHIAFSSASFAASEAQGAAPITVTVSPTSAQPISFTFAASGGTAGPADYMPISQVLTISPGLAIRVVGVQILTDTLTEPDESVLLSLSQPVNAQLGQLATATLTIHDSPWQGWLAKIFLPLTRR